MKAFLELMRLPNALMTALAVAIGYAVASGFAYDSAVLIACASAFIIMSGGMACNDYFDRKIDAKNKKHRPIPSKRVKAQHALWFGMALFAIGIIMATQLPINAFYIAIIASILLFAYAWKLAGVPFIGNVVVALNTGLTFVFGEAVTGGLFSPVIAVLFFIALFSTLSREVYKDIQDVKADAKHRKTLPMIIGQKKSALVAGAFLLVAVAVSPLPAGMGFNAFYLPIIAFVDIGFIYTMALALKQKKPAEFAKQSKHTKLLQALALLAFLIGAA